MKVQVDMNTQDLIDVANYAKLLPPVEVDSIFVSLGSIEIFSKDDYKIGEFFVADDFWMFRAGR